MKTSMSRKLTSACERTAALEHLERHGWTNAELIWEQIQEEAATVWLGGDEDEAMELWQGALEITDEHFAPHDLRRVTSRLNASAGSVDTEVAARDWEKGESWVSSLKPVVRARSSMFHLRLRTKHPGAYDDPDLEAYRVLARRGLDQLHGEHGADGFRQRVVLWQAQKPRGFNDYRKLLAAVLLLRYPD